MKVLELKDKMEHVNIDLEINELSDIRTWARGTYSGQVQTARCKDEDGIVCYLSLWHEDVGKYAVGDKITLVNGYCTFYQDEEVGLKIQLTAGKYGKVNKK